MSMTQLPELMTPAEVAEALRLSDETIHRWARIGKLPHVDVLGVKRFRREDVEAILRGETPASAA
jgi:excisionase family DNA binding protein